MSTTLLDNPKIRHARASTEVASQAYQQWLEQRCYVADDILRKVIDMVALWKDAYVAISEANEAGQISDYTAIGDAICPYIEVSYDLMAHVYEVIENAKEFDCPLENESDFRLAEFELDEVVAYFSEWPRSHSVVAEEIRAEFARGEGRPFGEFLHEVQAHRHEDR